MSLTADTPPNYLTLTECPRDAWQGLTWPIPMERKLAYLRALLACRFDVLDAGSFVSPKAMPQMADTAPLLEALMGYREGTTSKILAIVANDRGVADALTHPGVDLLGYPLSVSEEFQQRNTRSSIREALTLVGRVAGQVGAKAGKGLVVYLSMAFGNPYDEPYEPANVALLAGLLADMGVAQIALSDTVAMASPGQIGTLYQQVAEAVGDKAGVSLHLHTRPESASALVEAAWLAGCRHLEGALGGYGGCPMAKDDLTGNLPTEAIIAYARDHRIASGLSLPALEKAREMVPGIFSEAVV